MRLYLKAKRRAALMVLRRGTNADYDRVDAIEAHNRAILSRVYDGLLTGEITAARVRSPLHQDIYTRSLRGDFVQISHFGLIGGRWEALSHTDAHNVRDMTENSKCGCYITIRK